MLGSAALIAVVGEPVTQVLLVKAVLSLTNLVGVLRPETAGVGGQHLIAQYQFAVLIQTELELGVGNDNTLGQSVVGALLVDLDGLIPDFFGQFGAQNLTGPLKGDVFVVLAQLSLGGGGEQGLGELLGFLKALGQGHSTDGAGLLIVSPAGTGDIASDDALHGEHFQFLDQHASALEFLGAELLGEFVPVGGDDMVGHNVRNIPEPERGKLVEDHTLVRNRIGHDDIISRDSVGNHNHQAVFGHFINFADFSAADFTHTSSTLFHIWTQVPMALLYTL